MSGDSSVTVLSVTSGPKVDTSELAVGSSTVERQRMVIADPVIAGALANVDVDGSLLARDNDLAHLMLRVLVELRVISTLLAQNMPSADSEELRDAFMINERN